LTSIMKKHPREMTPAALDAARRRFGRRGPPPPPGWKSPHQQLLELLAYSPPEKPTITLIVDSDGRCFQGRFEPGRKKGNEA
jgi:hypothetical protein